MNDKEVIEMLQELSLNHEELEGYLSAQVQEINKYKWIESEHAARDIGFQRAALEWVERYGRHYFEHYWRHRLAGHANHEAGVC